MPRRYALRVDHYRVGAHAEINGAPLGMVSVASSRGFWQLEPFVVDGGNTVEVMVRDPQPEGRVHAEVQASSSGGAWSAVASKRVTPASPGTFALQFQATDVLAPVVDGPPRSALGQADTRDLQALAAKLRASVVADPGAELIALFSHWLGYRSALAERAPSELRAQLIEDFADLADPELDLVGSVPSFRLVAGGALAVALGADAKTWLRAEAEGCGVAFPLVFGRVDGAWAVVA